MNAQSHAEIHGEHREWRSAIKSWRDDIQAWKLEQARLKSEIETALEESGARMQQHAGSIGEHERHLLQHEHCVAECERAPARPRYVAETFDVDHAKEAGRHLGLGEAHEQIKRCHRAAMAQLETALELIRRGNAAG